MGYTTPGYRPGLSYDYAEEGRLGAQGDCGVGTIPCTSQPLRHRPCDQPTVEARLMAISDGVNEAAYLSNFMNELSITFFDSVPINCDSTRASHIFKDEIHCTALLLCTGAGQKRENHHSSCRDSQAELVGAAQQRLDNSLPRPSTAALKNRIHLTTTHIALRSFFCEGRSKAGTSLFLM